MCLCFVFLQIGNIIQINITLSQGVLELQESHKVDNQTDMAIQYFLDRFYMSRISMRMLIHQHTLLFEPDADHNTNRYEVSFS